MIPELCAAAVILACVIAIIYIASRPRGPVSVERSAEGGNVRLRVRANRDIARLEVHAGGEQGGLHLVRSGLRRNDVVEFSFPLPVGPVRVVSEDGNGSHTLELPS